LKSNFDTMTTIKLKISEDVYEKFIKLLNKFKSEEVEIVSSDNHFETLRNQMLKDLESATKKESKTYTLDEADELFEQTISKYEDKIE
jgi:predicted neutral ceramidase superfamily lipid hydrolase